MATRNYTWGILTSGLVSIFFYRHLADDTNGEPHHILSCSPPVYVDAAHPSLFSLCAATLLLDAQDPRGLVPRPISVRIALEPYPYPPTATPSDATRSKISQRGGSGREHRGRLACDVSGGNTPVEVDVYGFGAKEKSMLRIMRCSCTLLGVRTAASLKHRVGVRG